MNLKKGFGCMVLVAATFCLAGCSLVANSTSILPAAPHLSPTSTPEHEPTILGTWIRHDTMDGRDLTRLMTFYADGTYSITSDYDDDNEVIETIQDEYQYDGSCVWFKDSHGVVAVEPYYLTDSGNTLVFDQQESMTWKRVKVAGKLWVEDL